MRGGNRNTAHPGLERDYSQGYVGEGEREGGTGDGGGQGSVGGQQEDV